MLPAALAVSAAASIFANGISNLGQSFVKKADSDTSGGVSLGEFASIMQGGQNLPGSTAGTATSATPSEADKARFSKADTNTDGALSADEVNAYNQQLVTQIQSALVELQQLYGAGQNGGPQKGGHHHKHGGLADRFGAIDTNTDSSISRDELSAYFAARPGADAAATAARVDRIFSSADTSNDAALSKDELAAFDAANRKKRGGQSMQDQITALLQALDQANASMTGQTTSQKAAGQTSAMLAATKAYSAAA